MLNKLISEIKVEAENTSNTIASWFKADSKSTDNPSDKDSNKSNLGKKDSGSSSHHNENDKKHKKSDQERSPSSKNNKAPNEKTKHEEYDPIDCNEDVSVKDSQEKKKIDISHTDKKKKKESNKKKNKKANLEEAPFDKKEKEGESNDKKSDSKNLDFDKQVINNNNHTEEHSSDKNTSSKFVPTAQPIPMHDLESENMKNQEFKKGIEVNSKKK